MTLLTGTLYLGATTGSNTRNIRYEILGATGSYALSTAIAAKNNGPAADSMQDFAGYTHGVAPAAPTIGTAIWNAVGQTLTLSWTDNSSNEDTFYIYRGTSTNPTTYLISDTVSTYVDSPTCGFTYYYRVRAYNTYGLSAYSGNASDYCDCLCLLGNHKLMVAPNEYVEIEKFKVGDLVYTTHQDKPREFDYYKISKITKSIVESYYVLKFNEEEIRCSITHQFMCVGGKKKIEDIEIGDKVLRFLNDENIEIPLTNKLLVMGDEDIYSIEVEDAHTYITENGIIHHNVKE